MKQEAAQEILQIARTYIKLNDHIPPMIVSFDERSEPSILIGSFRNFQEQVTFCAVAKMSFILNNVRSYHILTHGFMREDLTTNDVLKTKAPNQLIKFLGKNKSKKEEGDAEVIIDAFISPKNNSCSVYKLRRNNRGELQEFESVLSFDSGDLIQGMFAQLIPNTNETIPDKLKAEVESLINRISYELPKIEVKGSIKGLDKLWAKKK